MTWGASKPTGTPQRMRRSRRKGANLQADSIALNGLPAVIVTRPTKHGNPFYPGSGMSMGFFDDDMRMVNPPPTPANCVSWFRTRMDQMKKHEPDKYEALLAPLRGKNLACYCALDAPNCHADVWLELANEQKAEAA